MVILLPQPPRLLVISRALFLCYCQWTSSAFGWGKMASQCHTSKNWKMLPYCPAMNLEPPLWPVASVSLCRLSQCLHLDRLCVYGPWCLFSASSSIKRDVTRCPGSYVCTVPAQSAQHSLKDRPTGRSIINYYEIREGPGGCSRRRGFIFDFLLEIKKC